MNNEILKIDVDTRYKDPFSIRKKLINNSTSVEWYLLGLESHKLQRMGVIDKLVIEDLMRTKIDFHNFQMATALRVLNEMHGLALLADEVGLGKTIETGLILKELLVRDRIRSILICCPASLVTQWKDEMLQKFGERFLSPEDDSFPGYIKTDKLVCSIAKLSHNIKAIASREWDMIVVDEAHLLANPSSKRRQAVAAISKRHMLLLTATPLQNKLTDLYSLIDLLYPGLLGSLNAFLRVYAKDYPKGRVLREDTAPQLRSHLTRVMCRTRREESGIPFVQRHVQTCPIKGYEIEYKLIDEVTGHMAKIYGGEQEGQRRYLLLREVMSLQQSLSSSPRALIVALENRSLKHPNERRELVPLIELAKSIKTPSKSQLLLQILDGIPNDQAIIFILSVTAAPNVQIYALKVLDNQGNANWSTIAKAIDWAITNRINVLNMSFGGNTGSKTIERVLKKANDSGILLVAAVGNQGNNAGVNYPAKYETVIAVGATDMHDKLAGFSNTGTELELVAPGVDISSTYLGNSYINLSGTSMAVPHVTGVAALIWSINPTLNNKEVRDRLKQSTIDLGIPGVDNYYGNGLIKYR